MQGEFDFGAPKEPSVTKRSLEEIQALAEDDATSLATLVELADSARLLPFSQAEPALTAVLTAAWRRGAPLDFIPEFRILTNDSGVLAYESLLTKEDFPDEPEPEPEVEPLMSRGQGFDLDTEQEPEQHDISYFERWTGIDLKLQKTILEREAVNAAARAENPKIFLEQATETAEEPQTESKGKVKK